MGHSIPEPPYDYNALKSRPLPTRQVLYAHRLPNVPGFSAVGILVTLPPSGATPPHRHGGASVSGAVLQGTAWNKMNNEPTMVLSKGESWHEAPGCHHRISANASDTEVLEFMAVFVVETEVFEKGGVGALVEYDEEFKEMVALKASRAAV